MNIKDDNAKTKIKNEFLAGASAGLAAVCMAYPLDTMKILHQINQLQQRPMFSSKRIIIEIFKSSRGEGFFRGLSVPLMTYGFYSAIGFGSYKYLQKQLDPLMENKKVMLFSSAITGVLQSVYFIPVENIKVRLQKSAEKRRTDRQSLVTLLRNIYNTNGIRGFYRGTCIQLLRDIPGAVLYFSSYDIVSNQLNAQHLVADYYTPLVAGGCAGLISYGATIPLDNIKTKVQACGLSGSCRIFVNLYRRGGINALFVGWPFIIAFSVATSAVAFFTYERMIYALNKTFP